MVSPPGEFFIVGLGGTIKPSSSTEQALSIAMAAVEEAGGRTQQFGHAELSCLPLYGATSTAHPGAERLLSAVRQADGIIIASPGYHGSISGLMKNALDYLEETARDPRVYLDGLPVGLIVTAYGWQATGTTLATLRSIVHALRGWPTPLGAGINCSAPIFADGKCIDAAVERQLATVGQQVVSFAQRHVDQRPSLANVSFRQVLES